MPDEHRTVIDHVEAAGLDPGNPNLAAGSGNYDHTDHIGDEVDEDPEVLAALARLDGQGS